MLAILTLLAASLHLVKVAADPTPLEPSNASVFNEGDQCTIVWEADPTGIWKTMNIELMTGSNLRMVHLKTVATVDGTSTENTTYSYPCLNVTPNSHIYFYQFTSPYSLTPLWTTRFTIADATGTTTAPTDQETTAAGEVVQYGTGALEDPSEGDEPPAYGNLVDGVSSSGSGVGSASRTATPTGGPRPPASSLSTTGTSTRRSSASESATVTPAGSSAETVQLAKVGMLTAAAIVVGSLLF